MNVSTVTDKIERSATKDKSATGSEVNVTVVKEFLPCKLLAMIMSFLWLASNVTVFFLELPIVKQKEHRQPELQ